VEREALLSSEITKLTYLRRQLIEYCSSLGLTRDDERADQRQ
jgi:hypothetical protein